jgi:hypothetical protein
MLNGSKIDLSDEYVGTQLPAAVWWRSRALNWLDL